MPVAIPTIASQILHVLGVLLLLTAFATVGTRRIAEYTNALRSR